MEPLERLREAAIAYADGDTAEESDAASERALDNLCAAAENYVRKLWRGRALEAQRKAKAKGKHIGRPYKEPGSVSRWTKWRRRKFAEVLARAARGPPTKSPPGGPNGGAD